MVTKESLGRMIETADQEKVKHIIGRALVALFRRQTASEKAVNTANITNLQGFNQSDARCGCLGAKYYLKHGTMEDWQVAMWLKKDRRGTLRIQKYWKQLAEEAKAKAAKAA